MAVTRIGRISFTTADANRLGAFYRQAFGFQAMEIEHHGGISFARLTGVEDAQARAVPLRLGEETIELLAFTEPGAPYPADIAATTCDSSTLPLSSPTWRAPICDCEHVRGGPRSPGRRHNDYPRIQEVSPHPSFVIRRGIPSNCSRSRPITCRRAGGSPASRRPMPWDRSFRIVVSRTAASVAFYQQLLGFSVAGRSLNRGGEQEQLDAVPGAVVEVTALCSGVERPPHLALLSISRPPARRARGASQQRHRVDAAHARGRRSAGPEEQTCCSWCPLHLAWHCGAAGQSAGFADR
jgi:catechol 2,3-dioxygenase-like lactoylglutathione lyase family enzyme